jgi:hypothetical protein
MAADDDVMTKLRACKLELRQLMGPYMRKHMEMETIPSR